MAALTKGEVEAFRLPQEGTASFLLFLLSFAAAPTRPVVRILFAQVVVVFEVAPVVDLSLFVDRVRLVFARVNLANGLHLKHYVAEHHWLFHHAHDDF